MTASQSAPALMPCLRPWQVRGRVLCGGMGGVECYMVTGKGWIAIGWQEGADLL